MKMETERVDGKEEESSSEEDSSEEEEEEEKKPSKNKKQKAKGEFIGIVWIVVSIMYYMYICTQYT